MTGEKGVSPIVGEILIISITFILTIIVLHYGFESLSGIQSGNIYLNGYVEHNVNETVISITSGTVPPPFSIEIIKGTNISMVNIYNFQKNIYNITLGGINFTIELKNYVNSNKLTAGDSIIIKGSSQNYISGSTFNIIYENRIIYQTTL
ncbi:MAG: archaellin/type IV pilin N-terminal domain-containing protein [Thermoplasmata archaeon]|jgi:FlaG/FlaF family flagellin (archaellin)|nr:hypothetical protein [Thermoplasmata archaeon]MVT14705.1 hypothetical protein [Euryarchaeota archaeon]MVT35945.1 hypothetical protein [Euryarchaeota archaeon]